MARMLDPLQLLVVAVAGWMNQQQQQAIEYLREENRVPPEQLGEHRLRFDDEQRRRLAVRAKAWVANSWLKSPPWSPDTLLAWPVS